MKTSDSFETKFITLKPEVGITLESVQFEFILHP